MDLETFGIVAKVRLAPQARDCFRRVSLSRVDADVQFGIRAVCIFQLELEIQDRVHVADLSDAFNR